MVNLLPKSAKITTGSSNFYSEDGNVYDITKIKPYGKQMREIRGNQIGMIFQDPMQSLNPVYTIGHQIEENILQHNDVSKEEARKIGVNMLKSLGIPEPDKRYDSYPHQFSGGMKQRVMICLLYTSPSPRDV